MGTVIELHPRRNGKGNGKTRGLFVTCALCGERHPVVRLRDGSERCVTAFEDGPHWFCRNRGCRAEWLSRRSRRDS